MSDAHITRTTALYPNGVFIQWDIHCDEEGSLLVDVERAGSPGGPWETLATGLRDSFNFLDDLRSGVNQLSLARAIYYRVTVVPPSGIDSAFSSAAEPVEPRLDTRTRLLKRKIQRDQTVGYKRLNGIQLIVLKRRRWGARCPACYDAITKQALIEHCPTCFGTSYTGGFWAPVLIRGRRETGAVQSNMTSHGDSDVKLVDFNILDYPLVEYKDVIVDLGRNDRYEVQRAHETELKSVPVHQKVTASLLGRNSVEYQIFVDPVTLPPLY